MSGNSFDRQGEAHEALSTAVNSYGSRVLSDPRILSNLVADLLPDLPRERSLLVTAAEAGVAGELIQHVEQQHLDVDTAIQLVARSLTERRSLDAAASTWVATEYAQALGYPVRGQAGQSPSAQDSPGAPPTVTIQAMPMSPPVAPMPVPPPPSRPNPQPQAQPTPAMRAPAQPYFQPNMQPPQPPQGPQSPQAPQAPLQEGPVPPLPFPQQPPYGGPPAGGRTGGGSPGSKRGLFAGGAVAGVVVLYLIVAAVAHAFPFNPGPGPVPPAPSPTITTNKPSTPSPSPTTPTSTATALALAKGVVPVATLLPTDLDDVSMECAAQKPPFPWAMPGLVTALKCTDPGLPGGQVFAFQLNSSANYLTTWQNFNKWWGFNLSTAGTVCPPSGGDTQGTTEWRDKSFPYRNGQVLECETVGSGSTSQAAYTWTFPTEDAFIIAQAAHSWTFSQLNTWWLNT